MKLPLSPCCYPLLALLAACHGTPAPATTGPAAARPAVAYEALEGAPPGPALRLLHRPDNHRTYAVRPTTNGRPDTVLLTGLTGRWDAPPQVGLVQAVGGRHYLVQLNLTWWDLGQHWTDVAVLCLGDTAATELLYAEDISQSSAEEDPRGFRLSLEPLPPAPADSARCWRVVVADSTPAGLRERVRREVSCHCR